VAYLPHAGTVETQKPQNTHTTIEERVSVCCSLLGNARNNKFAAQRRDRCYAMIGTHVSTTDVEFPVRSARMLYNATDCDFDFSPSVEAGSNTSTVALRVVGGDEKGTLKSETEKYSHEFRGTRTRE
jgi:hypothetical protein